MKTVVELARESGMELYGLGKNRDKFLAYLNELVSLVRADERERIKLESQRCLKNPSKGNT